MTGLTLIGLGLWATGTNDWSGTGNWTDAGNWSQAAVPGTAGQTDDDARLLTSTADGTITLSQSMFPGGLTVRTITGQLANFGSGLKILNAAGTAADPLVIDLGDLSSPPTRILHIANRQKLTLDWVNVTLNGTALLSGGETGIGILLQGNDRSPATPNLDATDSNLSFTDALPNPSAPELVNEPHGLMVGGRDRSGAEAYFTRGSLTVTNITGDSSIRLGQQGSGMTYGRGNARLDLEDTVLTADRLAVTWDAEFVFDNAGASAPSFITDNLQMTGGTCDLISGTLNVGALDWRHTSGPTGGPINISGATVIAGPRPSAGAAIEFDTGTGALNISAGALTATDFEVKAGDTTPVSQTGGTVTVNGLLRLGKRPNPLNGPAGVYEMSGGALTAEILQIGALNGDGYWRQTGGSSTLTSELRFGLTGPDGRINGGLELRLASGATMTLAGADMTTYDEGGIGGRAFIVPPTGWVVDGTLIMVPSSNSQRLIGAGSDIGRSFSTTNYEIATLDLSAVDGSEVVVVRSINETNLEIAGKAATHANLTGSPALYVHSLTGQAEATVTDHVDSTFNIYYGAATSPGLRGVDYDLNGGGQLLAIPAPRQITCAELEAEIAAALCALWGTDLPTSVAERDADVQAALDAALFGTEITDLDLALCITQVLNNLGL